MGHNAQPFLNIDFLVCKRGKPYLPRSGLGRITQEVVCAESSPCHHLIMVLYHHLNVQALSSARTPFCPGESCLIHYLVADNSVANLRCCLSHCLCGPVFAERTDAKRALLTSWPLPPESLMEAFLAWSWISFAMASSGLCDSVCAWGLSGFILPFHMSPATLCTGSFAGCRNQNDPPLLGGADRPIGAIPEGIREESLR